MMTAIATTRAPRDSSKSLHLAQLAAGAQDIVHQHHLFAGLLLQELAEAHGLGGVFAFRPVNLAGAQGFADAIGHRQAGIGRRHDGKLGNDGADLGVLAQQAAQSHAQHARVLVVAHGQRNLQILVGVQAVGVFKMAVAQRAGIAQNADDFVLCR